MMFNPPTGETDFMIDYDSMTAHLWSQNQTDMTTMLMMQMPNLIAGGFTVVRYIQDERPEIFGDEEE